MTIHSLLPRRRHVVGYTLVALLATTGTASATGHLSIRSRDIVNGQVKAKDLAKDSVTGAKMANESVAGAEIADGSVTGAEVADGSVTGAEIADGSLTGAEIADGSVTGAEVADGSVTGADVRDDALTGADILESSLTNVGNSQMLGGLPASAYQRAPRVIFSPGTATTIQPFECLAVLATGGALSAAAAGKVVTGYITDSGGVNPPPSLDNATIYSAGTVFKTSQGGAIGFVEVCNPTSQGKDLPTGWRLVGSVKP